MRLSAPVGGWPQRPLHAAVALACAGLLSAGYYLEWVAGLEPCPLCMSQRLCFFLVGIAALVAGAGTSWRWWLGGATAGIGFALAGGAVAVRQLWLQSLPEDLVPACGPTLAYMIDALPWTHVLEAMLVGDGNCAEVSWRMLGLSLPAWSLAGFVGLGAANVVLGVDAWRRRVERTADPLASS